MGPSSLPHIKSNVINSCVEVAQSNLLLRSVVLISEVLGRIRWLFWPSYGIDSIHETEFWLPERQNLGQQELICQHMRRFHCKHSQAIPWCAQWFRIRVMCWCWDEPLSHSLLWWNYPAAPIHRNPGRSNQCAIACYNVGVYDHRTLQQDSISNSKGPRNSVSDKLRHWPVEIPLVRITWKTKLSITPGGQFPQKHEQRDIHWIGNFLPSKHVRLILYDL